MSDFNAETVPDDVEIIDVFPDIETVQPVPNANIRVFQGDGSPVLHISPCTKIHSLQVGRTPIPPTLDEIQVVKWGDGSYQNPDVHKKVRFRLYQLATDAQGKSIVRRSEKSNHGIWQDGENIYIDGDWSDYGSMPMNGATPPVDPGNEEAEPVKP